MKMPFVNVVLDINGLLDISKEAKLTLTAREAKSETPGTVERRSKVV